MISISVIIKGFITGSTMMVPGVSGGSMAMILGLYDRLISSVSSFFLAWKKNLLFLISFCIPALLGIILCARPITLIIERFPTVSMFFFFGLVFGSLPMLINKAEIKRFKIWYIICFVLGVAIVLAMNFLPTMKGEAISSISVGAVLLQLLTGVAIAVGFILPGISTSYLLLLLGTYDYVMLAISTLNIAALVPFVLGFGLGVILLTKVLEICMEKFSQLTYTLIIGFLIGSVFTVYPGTPQGLEILFSVLAFAIGFVIIYFVSLKESQLE